MKHAGNTQSITTVISYFTGYNDDARVDISAIHAPAIAEEVTEFNKMATELETLGTERAALGLQIDEEIKKLKKGHPKSAELIHLHSQAELLTLAISDIKEQIYQLRAALRVMKFEGVKENSNRFFN